MKGTKALIVIALAIAVALSATGVALAQSRSPSPAQLQARGLDDHPGRAPKFKARAVMGEVTAVSGTEITLKLKNSATIAVGVTAETTYRKPGQAAASLADVTVGARVSAVGRMVDGSFVARQVMILPPPPPAPLHVRGKVTTVVGNTITIIDKDGQTVTLTLPAGTTGVSVGDMVNIVIGQPFPRGGIGGPFLTGKVKGFMGKMEGKGGKQSLKLEDDDDDEDDEVETS